MIWIISIMALLVALGALFFTGTTLNKLNIFSETLTKGYKAEVQDLRDSLGKRVEILDQRVGDLERNMDPLNKSQTNFGAEITAIRKQVLKLQTQLEKLE